MSATTYVLMASVAVLILAGAVVAELSHRAHQQRRKGKGDG